MKRDNFIFSYYNMFGLGGRRLSGIFIFLAAYAVFLLSIYYEKYLSSESLIWREDFLLVFIFANIIIYIIMLKTKRAAIIEKKDLAIDKFIGGLAGLYSSVNVYNYIWGAFGLGIFWLISNSKLNGWLNRKIKIDNVLLKELTLSFILGVLVFLILHIIYSGYRILPFALKFLTEV